MVAAHPQGAPAGVRGLVLRLRGNGGLNYQILCLKDKIATRSVPTGEVVLEQNGVYLLGRADQGICRLDREMGDGVPWWAWHFGRVSGGALAARRDDPGHQGMDDASADFHGIEVMPRKQAHLALLKLLRPVAAEAELFRWEKRI